MEDAPSSSRPAPLDVKDITPTASTIPVFGRCRVCHSFISLRGYWIIEEYTWDAVVASAHTCIFCDAIIQGCRGWLDKDGKYDWTPDILVIDFAYSPEQGQQNGTRWYDPNVYDFSKVNPSTRFVDGAHDRGYSVRLIFPSTGIHLKICAVDDGEFLRNPVGVHD